MTRITVFGAVSPCQDHANSAVCSIGRGREREGKGENFSMDLLVFGSFYQEKRDLDKVWGLADNFTKDLLGFGHGTLGESCK